MFHICLHSCKMKLFFQLTSSHCLLLAWRYMCTLSNVKTGCRATFTLRGWSARAAKKTNPLPALLLQIPNRFFTFLGQTCLASLIPPGSTGQAPVCLGSLPATRPASPFHAYLHECVYGNESAGGPNPQGFGQLTAWQKGADVAHPFLLFAAPLGQPHNYQFHRIDFPCCCFFFDSGDETPVGGRSTWKTVSETFPWPGERFVIFMPYPSGCLVS